MRHKCLTHVRGLLQYCVQCMLEDICNTVCSACLKNCAILCAVHARRNRQYCVQCMPEEMCNAVCSACPKQLQGMVNMVRAHRPLSKLSDLLMPIRCIAGWSSMCTPFSERCMAVAQWSADAQHAVWRRCISKHYPWTWTSQFLKSSGTSRASQRL